MAKIVDPDNLNQGVEVDFISGSLTITLNSGSGNMDDGGVSMQTLYSFIKEEWKNDNNLIKFPFPMISITSEQFELINGWDFTNSGSKYLIRDGGWAQVDPTTGNNNEEWMNVTTLGTFDDSLVDLAYFTQTGSANATPQDFQLPGAVNQAVQLVESGSYDYRDYFTIFLREQGKTYGIYDLNTEQNIPLLTYRKYAMPLSNGSDLKITHDDGAISTGSAYSGMTITYYTASVQRTLGATGTYDFDVIIDGSNGTAEEIYEFVQWSLRQTTDIDADVTNSKRGDIQTELLQFIGDTLRTEQGVFIDNFQPADTNRLEFTPSGSTTQVTYPYVAAGTIFFNTNLSGDADAIFKLFFTNDDIGDNSGRDFGTDTAIVINDNAGPSPIAGLVNASSSLQFDYDYDGNIQRGSASSGSDAPYTAVALGLSVGQYVVTTGTLIASTANTVNFVAALERNYLNP